MMPIRSCTLPSGGPGFKWGDHGTCYRDRADAERQAEAAHANGYAGDNAIAFDRSVRTVDVDGRMHVEVANLSKANVCPYFGREIPNAQALGLDPSQIYYLYRDPAELAAAAPTFNNLPVLSEHVPVSAADHRPELVVGSTGTDAVFEPPYLRASLVVWASDAISKIESGEQRQLSCAYRYTADMTPGEIDGVRFNGRMRNIVGNHVALVETGRAGSDVIIGDSATMAKKPVPSRHALFVGGAIAAYVQPLLAQDAKIDLRPCVAGITAKNWGDKRAAVLEAVTTATTGKLAQDASLDGLAAVLAALSTTPLAADAAKDEDEKDKPKAEDEDDDEDEKKAKKKADMDDDEDDDEDKVSKKAMDAAILTAAVKSETAAIARMTALRQAEKDVRPIIGEIETAMDSAADVYKLALDHLKVDLTGVPDSAYRALLLALPKPDSKTPIAQDSAASRGALVKMFPGIARIGRA